MNNLGVIFDMDGVLVDSGPAHLQSWQLLAREMGRAITAEQFAHSFGQRSSEIITHIFGITDAVEIARLDARKESLYRDLVRGHVPAMPGAKELVTSLHAAGVRLAVGSSGPPENVKLVCEEMGLTLLMSAIVTGMDVQRGKPDPQVFQVAAERLGLSPAACVVIEDAPVGIEAAHRAGMACIALTSSHPRERLSAAELVVASLGEIEPSTIRGLINR
ncbi:MAG: HAD family phosphatase [Planctomycetes bacterium]|nr:HAD family phosphatase [Planctomycetota bacterium]